jgi:hypothetical protein
MKEQMKERGKDKVFEERTDKNSQVRMGIYSTDTESRLEMTNSNIGKAGTCSDKAYRNAIRGNCQTS